MNNQPRYLIFVATVFVLGVLRAHAASVATGVTIVLSPDAPSALTATPNAPTQVSLSWIDNSGGAEDGFSVERANASSGPFSAIGTTGSGVATYVDNAVAPATDYFYQVRAFIGLAFSPYSNIASTTTPSPAAPPGNGGGGGGGGVGAGEGAPPAAVQGVVIFQGTAPPSSTVTLLANGRPAATARAGTDAHFEITLSDLTAGLYTFGVLAEDPAGDRSPSQAFTVAVTGGTTTVVSGILFTPAASQNPAVATSSVGTVNVHTSSTSVSAPDLQPPDPFVPEIGRDPAIFNDEYFVSFSATDQGSGINHYEVMEVPAGAAGATLSGWQVAQSPYLLKDQTLASTIYVRAVDNAGNFRVEEISPEHASTSTIAATSTPAPGRPSPSTGAVIAGIVALIIVLLLIIGVVLWRI